MVRDLDQEARLAARLLGSDVQRQVSGGAVYRYSGAKGTIQFHNDGSFSARFAQGAFPAGSDPAASAATLLERLDFTGELRSAPTPPSPSARAGRASPCFSTR